MLNSIGRLNVQSVRLSILNEIVTSGSTDIVDLIFIGSPISTGTMFVSFHKFLKNCNLLNLPQIKCRNISFDLILNHTKLSSHFKIYTLV